MESSPCDKGWIVDFKRFFASVFAKATTGQAARNDKLGSYCLSLCCWAVVAFWSVFFSFLVRL